jgi:hypothetical protein
MWTDHLDLLAYIWLVGWLVTLFILSRGLVALCVLHRGSIRKF